MMARNTEETRKGRRSRRRQSRRYDAAGAPRAAAMPASSLSGTTHNVFGIQVGVGITLAIKKSGAPRRLRYHRVPEMARKIEKLEFLTKGRKIGRASCRERV